MIKHVISELYINEAIRLRRRYFDVMRMIYHKSDELLECNDELKKIQDNISSIDIDNEKQLEFKVKEQQDLLETQLVKLQSKLKPDYEELVKIEEDTKILYDSIQEKYRGITAEEIKRQIIPHLIAKDKNN